MKLNKNIFLKDEVRQKGFTSIILILFIFVAAVAGGWYLLNQSSFKSLIPTTPPTPIAVVTPTPDPTANWKTVQTMVGLELKYPSNWYLEESGSSQFPTVRIQNYPPRQGGGSYNKGEFYFTIQRFPVGSSGIHSQEELINRLPKDGDTFMYVGSQEKLVIYKQENIKISQYLGVHRIYGIASSTDVREEIYYVLNPSGNVIQVEPKLDVSSQKQIFDQILPTFKFINQQQSDETANWKTFNISSLDGFGYEVKLPSGWSSAPFAWGEGAQPLPKELAQNFFDNNCGINKGKVTILHFLSTAPQADIDKFTNGFKKDGFRSSIVKTTSGIAINKLTGNLIGVTDYYAYLPSSKGYYYISGRDECVTNYGKTFDQILSTFRFD